MRTLDTYQNLSSVPFGNGQFVAVGQGWGGWILTSTDGTTWTEAAFKKLLNSENQEYNVLLRIF